LQGEDKKVPWVARGFLSLAGLARRWLVVRLGHLSAGGRDDEGLEGSRDFLVHGRAIGLQHLFQVYGVAATGQVQAHRVYHLADCKEVAGPVNVFLLGDTLIELDANDVGGIDEHITPEGEA
jgi:hypothetical protein